MIDETLNQPAAPGAPIQPPQMQPQAPPQEAPQQAQAAPEPKQSVWKSVVQGALVGLANSGGATSFGGGLGAGAQGVMNKQRQDQQMAMQQEEHAGQMKIRDLQTASMLASLSRQDELMHQQNQEFQMKLDTHAQNRVKFLMENLGWQFDAIPNSGDAAMGYLEQRGKISPDGQVGDLSQPIMSPSMIYARKDGPNSAEQEWEFARKMSPIFGLPVPPKETFVRMNANQRNAAIAPIQSLMAGHDRKGEFFTLQQLPQAIANLTKNIERAKKDPQVDQKFVAEAEQTLTLLKDQYQSAHSARLEEQRAGRSPNNNPMRADDPRDIAEGIIRGDIPPTLKGMYRNAAPVMAELARKGFNLQHAQTEWNAVQKRMNSLNSTQQVRLTQAVDFTYHSIEVIEDLYNQWLKVGPVSGFKILNKASLNAAKNLPGKPGEVATALLGQINDLTSEMANVYMGGNTPTEQALKVAATNLKADWNEGTFKKSVGLIKTNLQLRKNAIANSTGATGVSADSPYQPQAETKATHRFNPATGKIEAIQ